MLETYKRINDLAHTTTCNELTSARNRINVITERNQDFSLVLNEATTEYVLTGIGRIPAGSPHNMGWVKWGARSQFMWINYFEGLAKDLKRPFVFVEGQTVIVTRRKFTEPLIGAFMLTAIEYSNKYNRPSNDVAYRKTSDKWYFTFYNGSWAIVEHWLKECKTNPEFRRALRLI